MNDLLERAKAHFSEQGRRSTHVSEWDTTIYWTPWTVSERQRLWNQVKGSKGEVEINARALIMKAEDKDGKNLFTRDNLMDLLNGVDAAVVDRIGLEMLGQDLTVEQAEKN
jgi:hypothetical protein